MNSRKMDLALLEKLCNAHGVSGYEDEVADIIIEIMKETCDTVMKDSVGNVLCFKKGKKTPEEPPDTGMPANTVDTSRDSLSAEQYTSAFSA